MLIPAFFVVENISLKILGFATQIMSFGLASRCKNPNRIAANQQHPSRKESQARSNALPIVSLISDIFDRIVFFPRSF
jgi:hypothetical protein